MNFLQRINPFRKRLSPKDIREAIDFGRITMDIDRQYYGAWVSGGNGSTRNFNTEQVFKELSEDEVLGNDINDLTDLLVRNDSGISRALDIFVTLGAISFSLTCEDPRGQALLDDGLELLERKNNPFRTFLARIMSSAYLRGNIFAEVSFDRQQNMSNFFCIDPRYAYWEGVKDPNDGWIPQLMQWQNGQKIVIDSPNVIFMAINPLIDDIEGIGLAQTAFPPVLGDTFLFQDLRKVMRNHAWMQRFIAINQVELRQAGYSWEQVKEIVARDRQMIQEEWSNLDIEDIPVGTGEIEMRQYEGASTRGLPQLDTADRTYDRKFIRGAKTTPFEMGSNEFVAESSARRQAWFQSVWTGYHQDNFEFLVEFLWKRVLLAKGILTDPVFKLKRSNADERRTEALVFGTMMSGINTAVGAGMPINMAIMLYEHVTGDQIPEEWMSEIEEAVKNAPPPDTTTRGGSDEIAQEIREEIEGDDETTDMARPT